MPFISQEKLDGLYRTISHLEDEVSGLKKMEHLLGWAALLQEQVMVGLDTEATASEIGDSAYRNFYALVRDELIQQEMVEYQEQHRATLYKRAIEEVRQTEGDKLLASVRASLDSDPELAATLRASAREEVAARFLTQIGSEITEAQEDILQGEADRQLMLDGFDIEFSVHGELDIMNEDVTSKLAAGDTITLDFSTIKDDPTEGRTERVVLVWTKDVNKKMSWIYLQGGSGLRDQDGSLIKFTDTKFVYPGSLQYDLVKSQPVGVPGVVHSSMPFVLFTQKADGEYSGKQFRLLKYNGNDRHFTPLYLKKIDLRTKMLFGTTKL